MEKEKEKVVYNAVDDFLRKHLTSKNSRSTYHTALYKFFNTIKKNPESYFKDKELRSEDKTYENDLWAFIFEMEKEGKAPLTIKISIIAVCQYFEYNDIVFRKITIRQFKKHYSKGRLASKPTTFDKAGIKAILENADIRQKALFLTMLSSGLRRGALSKITRDDIDFNSHPVQITVPKEHTKSHDGLEPTEIITFISDEAKYYLQKWLEVRPQYITDTCKRLKDNPSVHKDPNDDTIFPIAPTNMQQSLKRLLERAGSPYNARQHRPNDKKGIDTGRYLFTCHGFRRFFRSNLNEVVPVDYVEVLMGHKSYLSDEYRQGYTKKLKEYYLKGMHTLTIFESGISEKVVSDKKAIIKHQQKVIDDLKESYEKRLQAMENKLIENADVVMKKTNWKCSECGHSMECDEPPKICPKCGKK